MLFLTAGGITDWNKLRSPHKVPSTNATGQDVEKIQGLGRRCSFLEWSDVRFCAEKEPLI